MERPENIVILLSDALRADALSCYGNQDIETPNIDRLADEGVLFENAYAVTNATDPSLTSIFSGRYLHGIGVEPVHGPQVGEEEKRAFERLTTFPEVLQGTYRTVAIDWLGRWHRKGFDTYELLEARGDFGDAADSARDRIVNALKYVLPEPVYRPLRRVRRIRRMRRSSQKTATAEEMVDKTLDYLDSDGSTFVFAHLWDTHAPYYSPHEDHLADISLRDQLFRSTELLAKQYAASVEYFDEQVGRLVAELEERDELDDTLVIVIADHGESLDEHGIYFDHHGLYEVSVRVPLIMRGPGFMDDEREERVQLIDLFPTMLRMVDEDVAGYKTNGTALQDVLAGKGDVHRELFFEEAVSQTKDALSDGRWKIIVAENEDEAVCRYCGTNHADGPVELYGLKEDPGETENLVRKREDRLMEWEERLEYHREKLERGRSMTDTLDI